MSPLDKKTLRDLSHRLRAADPADTELELSADESRRLRRKIMSAAEAAPRLFVAPLLPFVRLLAAAASVLVVALGIFYWDEFAGRTPAKFPDASAVRHTIQQPEDPGRSTGSGGPGSAGIPATAMSPDNSSRPTRTIHFVTSGGTRIIWTLNPDFDA